MIIGVVSIAVSFLLVLISFLDYVPATAVHYFTAPAAQPPRIGHRRHAVITVRGCAQSVLDVGAVREGCLTATGVTLTDRPHPWPSVRDLVNANNSCCSMFDACRFGLPELLDCAPFGRGTGQRTFTFQREDLSVYCVPQCTCKDLINCKVAVVRPFSSNHFNEAQDSIAQVQHFYPDMNIIVYNLGLTRREVKNLTTSCNVHVYDFPYEHYPAHVRRLFNYAWKPLMIGELAEDYEIILYGDASARMKKPAFEIVMSTMRKFPFVPGIVWSLPIVSLTHDGMLRYLNITLSRKELNRFGHLQAAVWSVWVTEEMRSRLIRPWTDCALHMDCIAPNGTTGPGSGRCDFKLREKNRNEGIYIGCHRYDQSALSMILIREYGIDVWSIMWYKEMNRLFALERTVTHHYKVQQCSH